LSDAHWAIKSFKLDESYYVAIGWALYTES
jgi:hypothetical protein